MLDHDPLERTPFSAALVYCSILSASFVGSLYYFIPPHIRILDRDNHQQIKWRTATTTVVCILSTWALSWLIPVHMIPSLPLQQSVHAVLGVVSHTALLYLGPIMQMIVQVATKTRQKQRELEQCAPSSTSSSSVFFKTWYSSFIVPVQHSLFSTTSSNERWVCLRNRIIAPVMEEVLFRRCIVPILWSTGMCTTRIVLVAPIFFGTAHLHHAFLRWHQASARTIVLQTFFQFLYTSVFGTYATYAYLRTGSTAAVVMSHAFCNGMGLPDLAFARPLSSLYPHRYLLGLAHICGIVFFQWGFQSTWLLPVNQSIVPTSQ